MNYLVNKSKGTTLAKHVEPAITFSKRFIGLMGRLSLPPGNALWLQPCTSIHTWFMRFPIDVAFVSKGWKVVATKENMQPWRFSKVYVDSYRVIELPAGTLSNTKTELGDYLELKGA